VYSSTLYQPAYGHLKSYYGIFEQLILQETNKEVKIAHFFDADYDWLVGCLTAHQYIKVNLCQLHGGISAI